MLKLIKRPSQKIGQPPGTLVHIGEKKSETVQIKTIFYHENDFQEIDTSDIGNGSTDQLRPGVTWINIDGLHQIDIFEKIGKDFEIHPLVLEDVLNTAHRPKIEDFGNYLFVVIKMLYLEPETGEVNSEQLSLILGKNFVLSFQERTGDVFDQIRERLRQGRGRIRKMGADYLIYSLIDAIIDNYFIILESLGETVEKLEEEVLTSPGPDTLQQIHVLKREMIFLRRSVWPLREVVGLMEKGEFELINDTTRIYLRDLYDHTIQIIDSIEALRDILTGLLDIYLSSMSNRMNEVMKVLTIIATIFIPLTFIAGVYGMNFKYIPELEWHWGYPAIWGIMLVVGAIMVLYFRKKKWF